MQNRHGSKRIALFAAILTSAIVTACGGTDDSLSLTVNGIETRLYDSGSGHPTLIFEAGLGDGMESFERVIEDLETDARIFAYSRPGYAGTGQFAADEDGRRTGDEIATHLHAVLDAAEIEPPYIFVAHSLGGLYALHFAKQYPDEVAGMVLVDARLAGFTEACMASQSGMCAPPGILVAMFPAHEKAEYHGLPDSETFAPRAEALGAMPITIIAADTAPALTAKDFKRLWVDTQTAFAENAVNGRFVHAKGHGHYVQKENPDLVIAEIHRILNGLSDAEN